MGCSVGQNAFDTIDRKFYLTYLKFDTALVVSLIVPAMYVPTNNTGTIPDTGTNGIVPTPVLFVTRLRTWKY